MMKQTVKTIIDAMICDDTKLVVAYSGGLDSTVLLHLIDSWYHESHSLQAVHVNHNLSANALAWQQHCQQQCQQWQIDFVAKSVHITDLDKGLEAEARKLRYQAISETLPMQGDCLLLTGQHQQDQLETFLLQLKRGAGPKGLSCMARRSTFTANAQLVRPLLNVSRQQLEQYAAEHQLSWIEDESNQDTRFERNFIRHQVVPILANQWPSFAKTASRSIALIGEQQQLVDELAKHDLATLQADVSLQNQVAILPLLALSLPRQRNVLRYWLASLNIIMPSQKVLDNIINEVIAARVDANPVVKWGGQQIRRFQQTLYLLSDEITKSGNDCLLTLDPSRERHSIDFNHSIGRLLIYPDDSPRASRETETVLLLRPPRAEEVVTIRFAVSGVRCKVQGTAHHKTLKQWMQAYRVPPWQRCRMPMIYYDQQLMAVAGLFVCQQQQIQTDEPEQPQWQWVFVTD